ncbi:hypothetical protein Scep_016546 [Stephania cephalantha]|uniref:Uncharacterized protein n=1 Tax=Stephania cephalantha TaxID=152367 RepID=A0AAP0IMV8_9MAGN
MNQLQRKGLPADRLSVWKATRKPKPGVPLDEKTEAAMTRIDSRLSEVLESERTPEMREALFKEVFGNDKRGRVRTYGTGTSRTDVFGHGSSKVPIDVEMQSLHNQLGETRAITSSAGSTRRIKSSSS